MAVAGAMVQGMDFVREQLEDFLPRESVAIMRRTTVKIAASVRNDIRLHAPRQSGTLRRAVISKRRRGTRDSIEAAVFITMGPGAKHDAYYWYWVEYGTSHSAAKPFVAPAVERARATYRKDIGEEVDRQVIKQLEKRAKRLCFFGKRPLAIEEQCTYK